MTELVSEFFANGRIIRVGDGDTVNMKLDFGIHAIDDDGDGIIEIRFSGIDTPESEWPGRWEAQPKSHEAKEFVVARALNKTATARLKGDRTYGRYVGEIFVGGESLNRLLVKNGLAWWNKKYEEYDHDYKRLESEARGDRIGIWEDQDPTPPWRWRRSNS